MKSPVSVAVLISAGRHPISGTPRACRGDAVAMALGAKLTAGSLRVVHAGDPNDPALPEYLALGAGHVDVLSVPDGRDVTATLAAHLKDTDVILTGSRAGQGAGSGLMPYLLARTLGRPILADVLDVRIENCEAHIRQFLPKGKRRGIAAALPLVLAVHPLAPAKLAYAHARRCAGRIAVIAPIPAPESVTTEPWAVDPVPRRAIPLKALETRDGHARMLSYVESQAKGGAVAFDGSPVDKAQILLTYLRDHRLVDF